MRQKNSPRGEDTICAISTPLGEAGIGIVRMSGPGAGEIAARIFRAAGLSVHTMASHTLHCGEVYDPRSEEVIDEVLLTIMRGPKSYTREDVVEVHCHGGVLPLTRILDLCLQYGARLAEPGEFTKRAFLNGRIDLAQAEAVIDIIRARTEGSLRVAVSQLKGGLSREIMGVRERLVSLLAILEASIDFVEEEIQVLSAAEIRKAVEEAQEWVRGLIATADEGRVLREGISLAIIGRPNVGKSSLLNVLIREDRAIVTPIPGTTRDILEECVNLRGIPIRLIDTAGYRQSEDPIEKEGVKRGEQAMERADLLLLMFDSSERLEEEDRELMEKAAPHRKILILNKSDLIKKIEEQEIRAAFPDEPIVPTSATTGAGIEALKDLIKSRVLTRGAVRNERAILTNVRHKNALRKCEEALGNLLVSVAQGMSPEFLAVDLRAAVDALGEITGETATDEILDKIFSEFCIGK